VAYRPPGAAPAAALGAVVLAVALAGRGAVAATARTSRTGVVHREPIPSFSRQTGLRCSQCHTTFPQLTPFGRRFKLNGYTLTGLRMIEAEDTSERPLKIDLIPPVSAMVQASFTRTNKARPGAENGGVELPQALSIFLGEAITPRVGTFLQLTYAAATGTLAIDNADIRYANHGRLGSREVIYGVTLNNNPTVQDVWNDVPAWRFPFASSSLAPTPGVAPLADGTLAQRVAGLGAYALWDNRVYGEFSVYRSAPQGGHHPPDSSATGVLRRLAPYWRAAWQHGSRRQYLEVGTYGMSARLYPRGVGGVTDRYSDIGLDAQYERRVGAARRARPGEQGGTEGHVTAHGSWTGEWQRLDASLAAGRSANLRNTLRDLRLDASYYAPERVGFTVAYFSVTGSVDDSLYAGYGARRPDSDGVIGELDYLPWLNTRFALQYVAYNKFNGSRTGDNNTLYLLAWLVF
jgi:hypothetical protein